MTDLSAWPAPQNGRKIGTSSPPKGSRQSSDMLTHIARWCQHQKSRSLKSQRLAILSPELHAAVPEAATRLAMLGAAGRTSSAACPAS